MIFWKLKRLKTNSLCLCGKPWTYRFCLCIIIQIFSSCGFIFYRDYGTQLVLLTIKNEGCIIWPDVGGCKKKMEKNYSMLSILYNMYSHLSYIIYFHEQWLELDEAVYHILLWVILEVRFKGCLLDYLLKQPSLYNTHELWSIYNHLESIEFIVVDVNDTVTAGLNSDASSVPGSMHADVTSD